MNEKVVAKTFEERYNSTPSIAVRAPGRINLIGEHTDYNDGFVLPASIDKAIYFCLAKRTDNTIILNSVDLKDEIEISLDDLKKSNKDWANFLIGVIKEIKDTNPELNKGFNLTFGGDVPLGAGLSSSAAIESGLAYALNQLYDLNFSLLDLAKIAQKAEHNFAGVRCGIMDMYASLMGKKGHVIQLDCKNLTHTYLPFEMDDIAVLLFNSGVKHNLAESAYNERREQCEKGLSFFQNQYPEINSFRDLSFETLEKHKADLDAKVYDRCLYVLSEEDRMKKATVALTNKDLEAFGELMYQTHEGLKSDYEVSCDELDFLVDLTKDNDDVLGARMMGGGFGGCTINIVKKNAVSDLIETVKSSYLSKFGIDIEHFQVQITDGCSVIYELA
ncbi:galactokinase [Arcticibacterium luteifluviistationis]|uniref:Galactokinase n=1 Tax=Arcticibacterium luteifluviistationis TaxID=1784714 RepID=A0A2Z4GBK2_9BACT|nr:galactokinase [Arcticibacterium luteifluviistationis]AWV98313.1 galactokinase [Arcticibacterium luteifluviistationis]